MPFVFISVSLLASSSTVALLRASSLLAIQKGVSLSFGIKDSEDRGKREKGGKSRGIVWMDWFTIVRENGVVLEGLHFVQSQT